MPGHAEDGGDGPGGAGASQHHGACTVPPQAIMTSGARNAGRHQELKWPAVMTAEHAGDDA